MKISNSIIILSLLSALSCDPTTKSKSRTQHAKLAEATNQTEFIKEDIIGVWAENETDNAIFQLTKDSVYYVEFLDHPYKYDLKNDKLIFYLDGFNSISVVLMLTSDSLVIYVNLLH